TAMQRHPRRRVIQGRSGGGFAKPVSGSLSPEDARKLLVPVEDVDAVPLLVGEQREFGLLIEIRADERIAALDVVTQVRQGAFLKHAQNRLKALLRLAFEHFEQE